MTDRCICSHLWQDHAPLNTPGRYESAVSCYSPNCPCNCQPVAVQPAPDTARREIEAAAWDAVAWLESGRTDQAEGDAATSSRLRAALETDRD